MGLRPVNLRFPPPGLRGGAPGALGRVVLNGEATERNRLELRTGDELRLELPGGGGFGPPEARDPALEARDRDHGYRE